MQQVKGTTGYSSLVHRYAKATEEIPFEILHRDFLEFIPTEKSLVVDIGAGTGRDAYHLSLRGHAVLAIEPLAEFRALGSDMYKANNLQWVEDSLPKLDRLIEYDNRVDFALCSSVWHHLDETEQEIGIMRVAQILKPNGVVALSLRNGPAGVGTHVFPTNLQMTIHQANECELNVLFAISNQRSLMKNKEAVKWSRLVLRKESS